jgi:HK97 family phage major capsid protein
VSLTRAEQRAQLLAQATQLIEKQDFSKEDKARFDSIMTMCESMTDAGDEQRKNLLNATLTEMGLPRAEWLDEQSRVTRQQNQEIRSYLRYGREARTYAGMSVATDTEGGYFVPAGYFKSRVFSMLKTVDRLFDPSVVTMYQSENGNVLTVPLLDDTGLHP